MDIRSYHVFLTLAECLHFGRTAERCNLSASAVSRLLQRLEEGLGQTLFERDNRRVRLTPAGRRFEVYARQALEDWQQLKNDLTQERQLRGEVSVFGSVTASYSVLTHILPLMRDAHPGIEIKLRTGDQAEGIEHVLAGREDCAIVARPDLLPSGLEFLPLQDTPLQLIGPVEGAELGRHIESILAQQQPPDWHKLPLVLVERGLSRDRFLKHLQQRGLSPPIYAQIAGHEAVIAMVALGFGVAVVPELVVQCSPQCNAVRVLPWIEDLAPFSIGLCARAERVQDPLLQAFWRCAERSRCD